MNGFGILTFLAGALQLTVPSYALRLVRRFGAQRVGWFIAAAFGCLALLHLLCPIKIIGNSITGGFPIELVYAGASVLLLLGMGHTETLWAERQKADREEKRRRAEWEAEVKQRTVELEQACQKLQEEITRRDLLEKTLRDSEAQYRCLFAENPQPMCILDLRSTRFLAVNRAALQQYGFTHEDFQGLTIQDLLPAGSAEAFLQDLARPCSGAESRGVWQHCRKDWTTIEVEITAVDMKYGDCPARLILATDVTRRERQQQQQARIHKMEALGQLAAGVAHRFNELLLPIDTQTKLLLRQDQPLSAAKQLEQIAVAVARSTALTRQLLATSGNNLMQQEVLNLSGLVQSRTQMLRRVLGDFIVLSYEPKADLPPILADPHLVEQVLVNLTLNAREAMPRGGSLMISTTVVRLDKTELKRHSQGRPGEYVCLSLRDTGCGIAPDVQDHLFEPFCTTRQSGQGAGLGLASAYGTVRQHGGWIEFSTEPGIGTEFRVFFPSAPSTAETAVPARAEAGASSRKTVLLVDPEDRARGLARHLLSRHGYHVIEADAGPTALVLWERQGAEVNLLLTSVTLRGDLSGTELADQLRQTKPDLKVLYTTEPEDNAEAENQGAISIDPSQIILKPYSPERLLEPVEALVGKPD